MFRSFSQLYLRQVKRQIRIKLISNLCFIKVNLNEKTLHCSVIIEVHRYFRLKMKRKIWEQLGFKDRSNNFNKNRKSTTKILYMNNGIKIYTRIHESKQKIKREWVCFKVHKTKTFIPKLQTIWCQKLLQAKNLARELNTFLKMSCKLFLF